MNFESDNQKTATFLYCYMKFICKFLIIQFGKRIAKEYNFLNLGNLGTSMISVV
jgi:hypothetical protein